MEPSEPERAAEAREARRSGEFLKKHLQAISLSYTSTWLKETIGKGGSSVQNSTFNKIYVYRILHADNVGVWEIKVSSTKSILNIPIMIPSHVRDLGKRREGQISSIAVGRWLN